jgi:hypothetical protein
VDLSQIFKEAYALLPDGITYFIGSRLAELYPDKKILQTEDYLNLGSFAKEGHCDVKSSREVVQVFTWRYAYKQDQVFSDPENTVADVIWNEHALKILTSTHYRNSCERTTHWIIGDSLNVCKEFLSAHGRWVNTVSGEVLVFNHGYWSKSKELFDSIQASTRDNLILAGSLKEELFKDLADFFAAAEHYRKYKIAWKRGILLLGPPGNGKTHAVKALVNRAGIPCLYVRSLKAQHRTDHTLISNVFSHAREVSPCILVFEDLDTLINPGNRSYFLNELDGFESNDGIFVIATTNYPEKLDPAIMDRPSRFDRKYTFDLPEWEERQQFLRMFSESLDEEVQLSKGEAEELAHATTGFSFAYLKELYLSAMMRWIADPSKPRIGLVMSSLVDSLRAQMTTEPVPTPEIGPRVDEEYEDY